MKKILSFVFLFFLSSAVFCGTSQAWQPGQPHDKYTLQKIVILSRHNIRSPMTEGGRLDKITPHEWFKWTSAPAELSVLGGQRETMMGQFFRKWLASENFITENYLPKSGEMFFYANSRQRTIATAQYFSSGMLPMANTRIEYKKKIKEHTPGFSLDLSYAGDNYTKLAKQQFDLIGGADMVSGKDRRLAESFALLEKVLDYNQSVIADEIRAKAESATADDKYRLPQKKDVHFTAKDTKIKLKKGKGASMKGTISSAVQAADALILQYYEEPDDLKAAFGHNISFEDWQDIGRITNYYGNMLLRTPAVAVNIANPMIRLLSKELSNKKRRFSFICGHDSTIASVMAALNAETLSLPDAVETATPIGGKLMFAKWIGQDGKEYASVDMVYQTARQIRGRETLSLQNPPAVYPITLQSLPQNEDGFYNYADVQQRFSEAISSFKQLKEIAK